MNFLTYKVRMLMSTLLHDRKVVVIIRELLMFERFLRIALSRMFAQMLFILHNTLMSFLQ